MRDLSPDEIMLLIEEAVSDGDDILEDDLLDQLRLACKKNPNSMGGA